MRFWCASKNTETRALLFQRLFDYFPLCTCVSSWPWCVFYSALLCVQVMVIVGKLVEERISLTAMIFVQNLSFVAILSTQEALTLSKWCIWLLIQWHILFITTHIFSYCKKKTATKAMWAFYPSSIYSISPIIEQYELLTFGVKTSVHDQETQCWFNTYMLYHIQETENGFLKYALNHETYLTRNY